VPKYKIKKTLAVQSFKKKKKPLAVQEEFGRDSSLLNSVAKPKWRFPVKPTDEMNGNLTCHYNKSKQKKKQKPTT